MHERAQTLRQEAPDEIRVLVEKWADWLDEMATLNASVEAGKVPLEQFYKRIPVAGAELNGLNPYVEKHCLPKR